MKDQSSDRERIRVMSSVITKLREIGQVSVGGGWGEGRRRGEEMGVELGLGFWN